MNVNYFSIFALIAFSVLNGFCSTSDSLLLQAQKLFTQGSWEAAAKNYESACTSLTGNSKKLCQLGIIKALSEVKKTEVIKKAENILDGLLSQSEPGDSMFAELYAADAVLQLMLGNPTRATRSWTTSEESANPNFFPILYLLCTDIVAAYPQNALTKENCNKIRPSDTSFVSLPRSKIEPLAKMQTAQAKPVVSGKALFFVQLGAFSSKANAENLATSFQRNGIALNVTELPDRNLFAVRSKEFDSRENAVKYAEQNFEKYIIVETK